MMILDIGAPVSIAGILWMTQYLEEFGLGINEMKSVKCQQPFRFGPLWEENFRTLEVQDRWTEQYIGNLI